jgi:tRNA pseudouridine38-40 synthase
MYHCLPKISLGLGVILIFIIATTGSIVSEQRASRYRARVAYDGHSFAGFQLQTRENCRTVQGALEGVINRRLLGSAAGNQQGRVIKVVAASRTDAGVHARGQAIHFDVPCIFEELVDVTDLNHVCKTLNDMLSPEVRIWNLQRVDSTVIKPIPRSAFSTAYAAIDDNALGEFQWNVLFDSTKKMYSYRLNFSSVMDPIHRWTRWHPPQADNIDVDLLSRILSHFVGTHDFRAFAGAVERNEKTSGISVSTIRTVFSVDLVREDDVGNYRIDFAIKGALYKQIRNMVGTALDVCRGELTEEKFLRLLNQDSTLTRVDNCCKPAPPEGLTLEHVYFHDLDF